MYHDTVGRVQFVGAFLINYCAVALLKHVYDAYGVLRFDAVGAELEHLAHEHLVARVVFYFEVLSCGN